MHSFQARRSNTDKGAIGDVVFFKCLVKIRRPWFVIQLPLTLFPIYRFNIRVMPVIRRQHLFYKIPEGNVRGCGIGIRGTIDKMMIPERLNVHDPVIVFHPVGTGKII